MTACKHSYSALRESTGLDPDFIRRLMRTVTALKTNHTAKGERGELLFDDQALSLLRQAAQWRSEKMPFKAIAKALAEALGSDLSPASPVRLNPVETELRMAKTLIDEQQLHLRQLERERAEAERLAQSYAGQLQQEQAELVKLKANLEKLRCEAANLIKDFQSQKLAARERAAQRALLLDQLEQLDPLSWAQGGRKRELLTQIRELS